MIERWRRGEKRTVLPEKRFFETLTLERINSMVKDSRKIRRRMRQDIQRSIERAAEMISRNIENTQ
jgi:hypothetical protein